MQVLKLIQSSSHGSRVYAESKVAMAIAVAQCCTVEVWFCVSACSAMLMMMFFDFEMLNFSAASP